MILALSYEGARFPGVVSRRNERDILVYGSEGRWIELRFGPSATRNFFQPINKGVPSSFLIRG